MKFLRLLRARLYQYRETNPFAAIMLLTTLVISVIILLYVYGNTLSYFNLMAGNNHFYRQFTLQIMNDQQVLDIEGIMSLEAEWPYTDAWADPAFILEKRIPEDYLVDSSLKSAMNTMPSIEAELHDRIQVLPIVGFERIDETLLESDPPVIILPESIIPNDPSADLYHLGETSFEVVGQHEGSSYVVSYDAFIRYMGNPDALHIRFPTVNNNRTMHLEIQDYLQNQYPSAFIQPPFYSGLDPTETNIITLILGFLYALALLSLSYLSQYLYTSHRSDDRIYWTVGASIRDIKKLRKLESLALTSLAILLASLLHYLLYAPVFARLNLSPDIQYSIEDYLRVALLVIFINFLLSLWNNRHLESQIGLKQRGRWAL